MATGIIGVPDAYLFPELSFDKSLKVSSARHKFEAILNQADILLPGRKKHERGPCLHCLRHVFTFKAFCNAEMDLMILFHTFLFTLDMTASKRQKSI